MSGIYIPGVEMPETCYECPCGDNEFYECKATKERFGYHRDEYGYPDGERQDWCPLVPVPPHGRLIDADALHKLYEDQWHYLQVLDWNENPTAEARQSGINWCINTMHDDAPTIIPVDKDGEG